MFQPGSLMLLSTLINRWISAISQQGEQQPIPTLGRWISALLISKSFTNPVYFKLLYQLENTDVKLLICEDEEALYGWSRQVKTFCDGSCKYLATPMIFPSKAVDHIVQRELGHGGKIKNTKHDVHNHVQKYFVPNMFPISVRLVIYSF